MIESSKKRLFARLKEAFHKVVKYTTTPIQFYLGIVFILVSLIGFIAWKSNLSAGYTIAIIIVILILIASDVIWVSYLLVKNPKNLVLGKEEYITIMREKLGDNIIGEKYYSLEIKQTKSPISLTTEKESRGNEPE